jgi:hypothetical protein
VDHHRCAAGYEAGRIPRRNHHPFGPLPREHSCALARAIRHAAVTGALELPPRSLANTFTCSPPAEAEWLPLFAAANGFDGLLRWAYHSWVENPLVSTDFTSWQSGDCFLVYPGDRSSLRFERLRDGIESFEKIRLLRGHAAKSSNPALAAKLAELDQALAGFTWERGSNSGVHAADVLRLNQLLRDRTPIADSARRFIRLRVSRQ